MSSFIICTSRRVLFGLSNQGDKMAGHVARVGNLIGLYGIPVEKREEKRPVGRPRIG